MIVNQNRFGCKERSSAELSFVCGFGKGISAANAAKKNRIVHKNKISIAYFRIGEKENSPPGLVSAGHFTIIIIEERRGLFWLPAENRVLEEKMTQRERMMRGLPYRASDGELAALHMETVKKIHDYNSWRPEDVDGKDRLIRDLLGKTGKSVYVEAPFYCDYGFNIQVGENFYSNFNLTILDVNQVIIGDNVMFAPNVSIYTAGHPIHPASRNSGYEYGIPVRIGNNVWLGGNVVVVPGVTIGNDVVVGAGSVVTRDLPDRVIAAGNPCRVIREITEADRKYYFRDREFDVEDY